MTTDSRPPPRRPHRPSPSSPGSGPWSDTRSGPLTGPPSGPLATRLGETHDVDDVTALHARCTPRTLERRFHAAQHRVTRRIARELVTPTAGWSRVAELDDRIVGLAVAGPVSTCEVEVGLIVEDAHQRQGIGSRLLHETAVEAAARGYQVLQSLTQPDNERVLATVRNAGLIARMSWRDGLLHIDVPLARIAADMPRSA
jgi:GNAT superfamily N-acetyltransferase